MELRQMRHFVAVADCGSLGKAAQRLNVSQPALSKSLGQLEQELGIRLFERSPRGVLLTVYGRSLLERARYMLLEAQNAQADMVALKGAESGRMVVGVSPSIARHILPVASAALLAARPRAEMTVISGMVDMLLDKVANGELDLAITALPAHYDAPDLCHELLFYNKLSVVTGHAHHLCGRAVVRLEELQSYNWILPTGGASARASLEQSFRQRKLPLPRPTVETDSIAFICSFLNESEYLSFLPHQLVTSEDRIGRLHALPVEEDGWSRPISATYRRRTVLPPVARALLQEIRRVCSDGVAVPETATQTHNRGL